MVVNDIPGKQYFLSSCFYTSPVTFCLPFRSVPAASMNKFIDYARGIGERKFLRGNHLLGWVILGKYCRKKKRRRKRERKERKENENTSARVWGLEWYGDFVKWRVCSEERERERERERGREGDHGKPPFWKMLQPADHTTHAIHSRQRKLTPLQPPTFQSHWLRRLQP